MAFTVDIMTLGRFPLITSISSDSCLTNYLKFIIIYHPEMVQVNKKEHSRYISVEYKLIQNLFLVLNF